MPRAILLLTALVPLCLATTAQAQARRPADDGPPSASPLHTSPLDSKPRAKAEWQVKQADIQELMNGRARAAWLAFQGHLKDFVTSGRGTFPLLEAVAKLRAAELALADNERERLAILERAWRGLRLMDDTMHERYDQGRVNYKDWLDCRHARLTQEIELCQAQRTTPATPVPLPLSRSRGSDIEPTALLFSKQLARDKFEAVRADPKELARARLYPAEYSAQMRLGNLMCGRASLGFTLQAWWRLLQTRLAVMDKEIDRRAAIEQYWQVTAEIDDIYQAMYAAGRIDVYGRMLARERRLEAEHLLRSQLKDVEKQATRVPLKYERWCEGADADAKALARAKFEAWHSEPRALPRSRLEAALVVYRECAFPSHPESVAFDFTLAAAARRLLEAELAVAENDATRLAARRRYWDCRRWMADINKARYDAGRIDMPYYAETVRDLRKAEIELLQAWQKK